MGGRGVSSSFFEGVRTVSVPVSDQDKALEWYAGTLGFTLVRDMPTPRGGRFIELLPGGGSTSITLELVPSAVGSGPVGIRFQTRDAAEAHDGLSALGVDVDEILRWPGVPPMFAFRDPDGNSFSVTEAGA